MGYPSLPSEPYPGSAPGFAPPPPAYGQGAPPPGPPPPGVVMVTQPTLGNGPVTLTCPQCRQHVTTQVTREANTKTHLFALLLCLLCPCFSCVPYCSDSCQSASHTCPMCHQHIGTFSD